jgi:hypothetical protein
MSIRTMSGFSRWAASTPRFLSTANEAARCERTSVRKYLRSLIDDRSIGAV